MIFKNNRYATYNQFNFSREVCLDCTKNLRLDQSDDDTKRFKFQVHTPDSDNIRLVSSL